MDPPPGYSQAVGRWARLPYGPVVAVLAVVGLWLASSASGAVARVPDLVGLDLADARAAARDAGYVITEVGQVPGGGAAGSVVGQAPPAGTLRPTGTTMDVEVTEGVDQVDVPNVVGQPLDAARRALVEAGLEVGDVRYRAGMGPSQVTEMSPEAGTSADRGSSVDLTVSR